MSKSSSVKSGSVRSRSRIAKSASGCGPRGLVTDRVPDSWRAGALLVASGRHVAESLVHGRAPRDPRAIKVLLGRVMQARLQAAMNPAGSELELSQLAAAQESLTGLLDQCDVRKSHGLEWVIIWLIALDILACVV